MIGLITVNYNNAKLTRNLIESISDAGAADRFYIVIVDNASDTDDWQELESISRQYKDIHIVRNKENIGYFRALNVGINYLRKFSNQPKAIVICNNDIEFKPNFYYKLTEALSGEAGRHAVIAPNIITPSGLHQNPHVVDGVGWARRLIWDIYYSNYLIARIIYSIAMRTRPLTSRRDTQHHSNPGVIDQGYGACYILTSHFFEKFQDLWAPTFLMGEEYFLSQQLYSGNLSTFYEPSISLIHLDHGSVGKMQSKKIWQISKESHKIRRNFCLKSYGP